ncbi:SWIM zinc finger family protein [Solidesulfovibrio sp.]|uniref:SWIM zinc finger family protein n=1 Tax=Solidesulfovibrio sp. TaxID=2910990 RepID=UPI002B22154B|nr:SWIM zinc finger family protein [Solidesulfovibrio sp.]MEA5089004.1 SWIM zinc finger family protein [Solidesulfovibrio sp.]
MSRKLTCHPQFESLSWDDLVTWAGSKVAGRGREYQRENRVKDLAVTETGGLIASVIGSDRYAVQVRMDTEGTLESHCTCPYGLDCKHGVATVLEYLARVGQDRPIPKADPQDERLAWTNGDEIEREDGDADGDDVFGPDLSRNALVQAETLLNAKTKRELVKMILGFVGTYPGVASALQDMVHLRAGDVSSLMARLRREIHEVGSKPGWQSHWGDEGYTPDYSGIRDRLEALLAAGHADAVLALGTELIGSGTSQVGTSDDEGETAMEVSNCIGVLPRALAASSLSEAERLLWALDAVLDDPFDLCDDLAGYLNQEHPKDAWDTVADTLLKRLATGKASKGDFDRDAQRDHLIEWVTRALERAGREQEIVPLCEAEAESPAGYARLVNRLIDLERYGEAEHWIRKGILATSKKYPGIASDLRDALLTIKTRQQDWAAVAFLQVDGFVRRPSVRTFGDCKDAADRLDAWPAIRHILLEHLASGRIPWKEPEWPLPTPGKDAPKPERRDTFPRFSTLIEIAIHEKKPEEALRWYDRRPREHFFGYGPLDENVAAAVASHAPDRAIAIWKAMAEQEIARVKPSAYHEAAGYLRKVAKAIIREKREADWEQYLAGLRTEHCRKKRLLEVLDTLSAKPIVKKKR